MGKGAKKFFGFIAIAALICVAFLAGNYFDFNILTMLGIKSDSHTMESVPETEPHTAEQVVEVETIVPFDESGYGTKEIEQEKVPYVVEVDFMPVFMKEAQLEKKLIIMSQRATASEVAEKAGLFNLPVFKQTKAIIFHGEGIFFVDLSSMSSDDFVIDNENRTITIYIPKPELTVSLLPEETEFFYSSNGTLRFGEMEITPEIMTTLETQGIERITETLKGDTKSFETAEKFAKLSVKEIYEPLIIAQIDAAVKQANDEYAVPAYYTINVEIKKD